VPGSPRPGAGIIAPLHRLSRRATRSP
jgi:hypothetical protein